jgi:Polyketide cyclase / dehydrase and lipid transport
VIVDVDEARRRLAYSVRSERISHHNASFQVLPDGAGSRLVWLADVLPAEAAVTVGAMMEDGIQAARRALDGLVTA